MMGRKKRLFGAERINESRPSGKGNPGRTQAPDLSGSGARKPTWGRPVMSSRPGKMEATLPAGIRWVSTAALPETVRSRDRTRHTIPRHSPAK